MAQQLASLNGEIMPVEAASLPVSDEGFIRGDGVFEAMRLYGGVPFGLEAHLNRMSRSAANLRLTLDAEAVRVELSALIAAANEQPGRDAVRIIVTRSGRRLILTEPLPEMGRRTRLGTVTYSPPRILDGVKSLSYAANMLANRIAQENGHDEALLVTPHGRILEGPTSSVFWVTGDRIATPPLEDHILASITRAALIELCDVDERPCTLEEIAAADEIFMASSIREVVPVAALDGRSLPEENPHTQSAAEALSARIREETAGS